MKIKPLGFYVLVEMVEVESTTAGGIIRIKSEVEREQDATDVGYVRAIGPTAYVGYPGCELDTQEYDADMCSITAKSPCGMWGLELGQKIEYRRYEGKKSALPGYENYRYIPDSHIIGAIDED